MLENSLNLLIAKVAWSLSLTSKITTWSPPPTVLFLSLLVLARVIPTSSIEHDTTVSVLRVISVIV